MTALVVLVSLVVSGPMPVWGASHAGATAVVTASRLNLRAGPSQTARVVFKLEKGQRVSVLKSGDDGGWLRVAFKEHSGYVRNRPVYIRVETTPEKGAPSLKGSPTPPKLARNREKIQKQIAAENEKVSRLIRKEAEILEGLDIIDFALNQARVKAGTIKKEHRALAARVARVSSDRAALARRVRENKAYTGKRLSALYRVHMIGRLDMGGVPDSLFDYLVKQDALKRIIGNDMALLRAQNRDLEKRAALEADLAAKLRRKAALEKELAFQIQIQEREGRKKEKVLRQIQRKKTLSKAAVAALNSSAQALDRQIRALGEKQAPGIVNGGFEALRGQLASPVPGPVVSRFGSRKKGPYNSFTFQSGIDIKVKRGEPVRSVFKGEIVFSDWLLGYGNLIIINHGDNYHSLYAHVQEVFKKKGERVETGEMIATAGDTGSLQGLCLHFEIRHHGKAVNPLKWLKRGV